jgi:DNA polymerase-3 subunit delta'
MPFRDILGHPRLVGLLARSVRDGTLPPSLIFSGPNGIGKRLAAISTAQALNCTAPREASGPPIHSIPVDACGVCPACTRIARGVHPDVMLVGPGENGSIKIDQVRDIIERVAYRPFEGRRRAVIIDEADSLVPAAQAALLKTLEEPPSLSVFMLITSRPDTLLDTVRSRCPRLRFRPLDAGDVAAALVKRGRSDAEARAIAATADGSVSVALEAAGSDLVDARDVAVRVLAHASSSDDPRRRIEGAADLLSKTGAGGARDRDQLAAHLRAMSSLLRDVELLSVRADATSLANADLQPALGRLAAFRGQRGVDAFSAVDCALVALDRNAGVKIVADWLLLHL